MFFPPDSALTVAALVFCFVLVCVFEFANGFHDTANAVATVIYTNSLKPRVAVVLSAVMNFLGVLIGGIAVAYALVELLPPDVLSPPNGNPAVPMLVALFATALAWNLLTWWFGIPNSSSHCIIGALIGVAVGDALITSRQVTHAVDWSQIWGVLRSLAISPVLGLVGAGLLYWVLRRMVHDKALYEPPHGDRPPTLWVRCLLILTCTSVSLSHGTNDGQKSIGLIMLTVIGLMPATFALNPHAGAQISRLPEYAQQAAPLIAKFGDDRKEPALEAARRLQTLSATLSAGLRTGNEAAQATAPGASQRNEIAAARSTIRGEVYHLVSQLKEVTESPAATQEEKAEAVKLRAGMRSAVEYAPWWVRILSATCLGFGTMIGYKRIVRTLGERIGNTHLTPGQGACAELVGAGLIATAGFTGLPVSTTHIITSGIAGTMIGSRSGIQPGTLTRIALTWICTLPVTIAVAASLFYLLAH